MTFKRRIAYLAVGSVAIAGMTGAFGQAAFAAEGDEVGPTSGPAFNSFAQALLDGGDVQAVATDADGNRVVYTTAPVDELSSGSRFLVESASNNIVVQLAAPLEAYDTDEVVGGAGYLAVTSPDATTASLCSIGYSAWSADGDPAVISAGHCTADGANGLSSLTLPTGDTAGGGDPDGADVQVTQALGELAFSQYGGPGNTVGAEDENSVDISVIDVTNSDLELLPEVTDWETAESEDLAASTLPVRSVGSATVGGEISKSGRTTGFSTGTVQSVDGWALVGGRQVYGFMSLLESIEGDSGGSMIQGDKAVGILSGGGETTGGESVVWGADLQASLAVAGDYTVALYLDAPVLTSPADGGQVFTGRPITGSAPAGSTLVVYPGSDEPFEVAVDANGAWSFPAPGEVGDYDYTIRAERGFDSSSSTSFSVEVVPAPLNPVVFTSPLDGEIVETSVSGISGTGEPGATLTLTGAVEETLTVPADGSWSVDADLGYGSYSVTAVQTRANASASAPATVKFTVVPVAPVITDPATGLGYDQGHGPTAVNGTGIDGAKVSLTVNGSEAGSTTVKNGTWTIGLAGQLGVGPVTISATQSIDGVTSRSATSSITITAVDNGGGTDGGTGGGGTSTPAGNGSNGSLANTGAQVAPLAGGGIALLLAAGGLLLVARRTRLTRSAE